MTVMSRPGFSTAARPIQQRRLVLAPGPLQGRRGRSRGREHVVAVHPLARDPVGAAALPEFRLGRRRLNRATLPSWLLTITYTTGSRHKAARLSDS